jgi:hypothetical protein
MPTQSPFDSVPLGATQMLQVKVYSVAKKTRRADVGTPRTSQRSTRSVEDGIPTGDRGNEFLCVHLSRKPLW